MINLIYNIDPVAKGRPRFGKFGAYTPSKTRRFEEYIRKETAKQYVGAPLTEALKVTVNFYFPRPKSVKRKHAVCRPDLDNYIKCLDALNGLVFKDDSQIVQLVATKSYGLSGCILISIELLD